MSTIMAKWRDDGAKTWVNEREQDISKELDFVFFQTPGIYRTRQYEFSFTDAVPFSLIMIEEEVEALDN